MSRNFELLQQASPFVEEPSPSAEDQSSVIKLPATELSPLEKREILKLISALFRPTDPDSARIVVVAGVDQRVSPAWITACAGELLSAQVHESVCVLDANLHNRELHRVFGLPSGTGFYDAALGNGPIWNYCRRVASNLWVMTGGALS